MEIEKRLSDLDVGGRGMVQHILSEEGMRRRLEDLGMIPGTKIVCVQKSPLNDPAAYLLRGAVIALRREDSSQVKIWI